MKDLLDIFLIALIAISITFILGQIEEKLDELNDI
jgi:hypothetical protein